jgi:hypothetical protein
MKRLMWWLAGFVVVGAFAVGALGRRLAFTPEGRVVSAEMERRRVLWSQLAALREARDEALTIRNAARVMTRLGHDDTSGTIIDDKVSTALGDYVKTLAMHELSALELEGSRPIRFYIAGDLATEDTLPASRSRAPAEVTHLLPDFTGDSSCVSLIQLRRDEARQLEVLTTTSLSGVCGFIAAFGLPGPAIRGWMDTVEFSFAGVPAWHERSDLAAAMTREPSANQAQWEQSANRQARSGLHSRIIGCLMKAATECRMLLSVLRDSSLAVIPGTSVPHFNQRPGWVTGRLGSAHGPRLGPHERRFFSDIVYDFGQERFARFWTSPATPEDAFASAFGETLPGYTQRWLARRYDDTSGGPRIPLVPGLAALGLVTLSLGWSARRGRTSALQ